MITKRILILVMAFCVTVASCAVVRHLKGGLHRQMDPDLSIVGLIRDPERWLDRDIVFSVRFFKKGNLPCPLGDDYVNFVIADRVSYIKLDKVWIAKDKSKVLDSFQEMDTIIMKANVFKIDREKEPNLLATEMIPE